MKTKTMRAAVLKEKGRLEIDEIPQPSPGKGEALLRVRACGICGSDIPRIFGDVAYYYPIIPGHEFSGEVVTAGDSQGERWIGKRVTVFPLLPCRKCTWCACGRYELCDDYGYLGSRQGGACAQYVVVPVFNLVQLPDELSFELGAMTEPAAVTFHAMRRAGLSAGEKVVVFGLGTIGILFGVWARLAGVSTLLGIDVDEKKFPLAQEMGFHQTGLPGHHSLAPAGLGADGNSGFDLCAEASGSGEALLHSLDVVAKLGRVLLLGNQEKEVVVEPQYFSKILRKELTLLGTWNSSFNRLMSDWACVLEAEKKGQVHLEPLISHRVSLDSLPVTVEKMEQKAFPYTKVIVFP